MVNISGKILDYVRPNNPKYFDLCMRLWIWKQETTSFVIFNLFPFSQQPFFMIVRKAEHEHTEMICDHLFEPELSKYVPSQLSLQARGVQNFDAPARLGGHVRVHTIASCEKELRPPGGGGPS